MRIFAVFGSPIEHSLSPFIHQRFAEQTGIKISYAKKEPLNFEQDVLDFFAEGGHGLNITLPYKRQAWQLVKQRQGMAHQNAERAQAANTLFLDEDNRICAANTDGNGLLRDIQQNLKWDIEGRKIILLGAGGAAYGIAGDLLDAAIEDLVIVNRTQERAEELVKRFNAPNLSYVSFKQCASIKDSYDVLINATSVSLRPDDANAFKALISPTMRVYDLFYDLKRLTPFLTLAQQIGASDLADGLGMLVEQAALSFMIWNKDLTLQAPNTQQILQQLRTNK